MAGREADTAASRKQQMMIQSRELEELQTRIREAEERLKARQPTSGGGNGSGNSVPKAGEYQSTGENGPR